MDAIIELPQPRTTGGKPLMDCLKERHSTRTYTKEEVPLQELSNVLWAAFGLTRQDAGTGIGIPGSHTAPTACNAQSVDVYVALPDGVYLYKPHAHVLQPVLAGDIRESLFHPAQAFVLDAPVHLLYVVDQARTISGGTWDRQVMSFADSAFMAENVYLYCACAKLGTVIRAMIDREKLSELLQLRPEQMVTLSQTVGYEG